MEIEWQVQRAQRPGWVKLFSQKKPHQVPRQPHSTTPRRMGMRRGVWLGFLLRSG